MENKEESILLITYHPLNSLNGGTVMYKTLIENLPTKNLYWIGTGSYLENCPDFMKIRTKSYKIIRSYIFSKNWIRIFSRFPFNFINIILIYLFYTPRSIFIIYFFVKKHKINFVWIETFRQTYLIAYVLTNMFKIKVHLSVNDHYSAHCKWPEKKLLNFFCKKISKSKASFDFISEWLYKYYKTHYNFNSNKYIILWVGNTVTSQCNLVIRKNVKRIIFYGSIHGLDVIKSFCEYISNQEINENIITFDIYSEFDYSFLSRKYNNVNYFGKLTQDELVSIISNYDLAYVPIYFDFKNRIVSQTSLSSKMIFAINLGLPIFSHGPSYSANNSFINTFNLGFTCSSLSIHEIAKAILAAKDYKNRIAVNKSAISYSKLTNSNSMKAHILYETIIS